MASVFAKLAPDLHRHPKIRKGGRDARDVFVFVLCVNADHGATGIVGAGYVDPWYLADALMVDEATARRGLERCIEVRLLELLPDGSASIVGWDEDEWGRARHGSMTEAERKTAQRAAKAAAKAARSQDVRTCPDTVPPESGRPDMSRESETDQRQSRSEAEREADPAPPAGQANGTLPGIEPVAAKPKRDRKRPAVPLPGDFAPGDQHHAFATEHGLDLPAELHRFRLHHEAKGSVFASWPAALSTWLGNAVRFAAERRSRGGDGPGGPRPPAPRPLRGLAALYADDLEDPR